MYRKENLGTTCHEYPVSPMRDWESRKNLIKRGPLNHLLKAGIGKKVKRNRRILFWKE